jgi:hypothetical protein
VVAHVPHKEPPIAAQLLIRELESALKTAVGAAAHHAT